MSEERILLERPDLVLGAVSCAADEPDIATLGPIERFGLSFPRRPLRLAVDRTAPAAVIDSTTLLILRPGDRFAREPLSAKGAHCHWLALAMPPDFASRFAALPRIVRKGPAVSLAERTLFARAEAGLCDGDEALELAIGVFDLALERRSRDAGGERARQIAEAVRAELVRDPGRARPLATLASRIGVSVFQLCRAFRAATGSTIQDYARGLRLEATFEQLLAPQRVDLSDLAFACGFSSHSHFTARFRRRFGVTPSEARRRGLRPRRAVQGGAC
jgi:AraC-like DNA-binding protein